MKTVILGAGISGVAADRLARNLGYESCIVTDHDTVTLPEGDVYVTCPGMHPFKSNLYKQAAASGRPFISEMEFGYRNFPAPVLAITGTNGKTTTTELTVFLLQKLGIAAIPAGNIGIPLSDGALRRRQGEKIDVAVVEVSSFQLEKSFDFSPKAAVLLNIADDHLDRYPGGITEYQQVKEKIFHGVPEENRIYGRTFRPTVPAHFTVTGNKLFAGTRQMLDLKDGVFAYSHNQENLLAALELASRYTGITPETLDCWQRVIPEFKVGRHRVETVHQSRGIVCIDDSKATNPAAVLAALNAVKNLAGKPVLILGGLGKGMDFSSLRETAKLWRGAVLIGEAAAELHGILTGCGIPLIDCGRDFRLAVQSAAKLAQSGDAILLSPACASMDMFKNYEERGNEFARLAKELLKDQ